MTTITFDTHKFITKLRQAGFEEKQAEAVSEAFKDAQGEAELATQHDINDVRRDINDLRRDMESRFIQLEQWLIIKLGALMALSIGLVAALVKLL